MASLSEHFFEATLLQGECSLEDSELVRLKNTFAEGLEYLRNFQVGWDPVVLVLLHACVASFF